MSDATAMVLVIAMLFVVGVLVIALGWVPGWIARKRGHPSATAISICGYLGLVLWPLWIVAYIWAHTGPDRSAEAEPEKPDYHLGTPTWAGGPDDRVLFPQDRHKRVLSEPLDSCGNCGRLIGHLETPHLWGETVVCGECRKRLESGT